MAFPTYKPTKDLSGSSSWSEFCSSNCIYWDLKLGTPFHLFIKHSENCKSDVQTIFANYIRVFKKSCKWYEKIERFHQENSDITLFQMFFVKYIFRKWFSHCVKITYNFLCIHPVRRRKMFKSLIFQECFIFLKMWQKTFPTMNSGGKIWIRPRAPVQKAKLEETTRKHTN